MPTDKSWRILAIDDDPEIGEQIVRILTGELFHNQRKALVYRYGKGFEKQFAANQIKGRFFPAFQSDFTDCRFAADTSFSTT